jgi:hypothetical protein
MPSAYFSPPAELPVSRPLPEMPSRAARRAAVAVGTVAIALALTIDAGLATGLLSGSGKTATAQSAAGNGTATHYTLTSRSRQVTLNDIRLRPGQALNTGTWMHGP